MKSYFYKFPEEDLSEEFARILNEVGRVRRKKAMNSCPNACSYYVSDARQMIELEHSNGNLY